MVNPFGLSASLIILSSCNSSRCYTFSPGGEVTVDTVCKLSSYYFSLNGLLRDPLPLPCYRTSSKNLSRPCLLFFSQSHGFHLKPHVKDSLFHSFNKYLLNPSKCQALDSGWNFPFSVQFLWCGISFSLAFWLSSPALPLVAVF